MAGKFQIGSIVELKSGGPKMTVAGIDTRFTVPKPDVYKCQWFGGKKLEDGYFPEESLKLAEETNGNAQ